MRVGRLLLPVLVIQLTAANDLYAALGVSRNSDSRALKKAYRKMALQNHPDKQASLSDEQKKAATADFLAASNAYEVLSDPEKRRLYDRHGDAGERPAHRSGAAGFGSGDPRSEVFEAMFGTRRGSGGAFGGSGLGGTVFMGSHGNMYRQAGGAAAAEEERARETALLAYLRAQQRRQEQLQEQQRQRRQQQARQYQQQQQQQARQYQQQAAQADAERQTRQAVFDAEARAHAEAQAARRASKPKGGTGRRRAKLPARSQVLDL